MIAKIGVAEEMDLPEGDLLPLAQAVRENFELEPDAPIYMSDLLEEAARQGILPGLPSEDWQLDDDWQEPLTPEEIRELVDGPEEPVEEPPSGPHRGAEGARDDRAGPDCDGTVYGNFGREKTG